MSCIHPFAVKLHLSLVQHYLGSGSPLGGDESHHMGVTEWSQELSALRQGLKRAPPALRCGPRHLSSWGRIKWLLSGCHCAELPAGDPAVCLSLCLHMSDLVGLGEIALSVQCGHKQMSCEGFGSLGRCLPRQGPRRSPCSPRCSRVTAPSVSYRLEAGCSVAVPGTAPLLLQSELSPLPLGGPLPPSGARSSVLCLRPG